jgi:hypothetical protein
MAPTPFRRRKAAKTVRNLALAEAALALAKDRRGGGSAKRGGRGKLLLLGGAVAAAGAAALLKRDKVAGLLPSRSGEPEPPAPPAPPQPSNYDAPGPVANTATPIPAPDPQEPEAIDEAAEEAAAAAEAAAIGGTTSDYAGTELGEPADEAHRPLAEAGQGESEGQEQAEAELAANAEYRDSGLSDAERQIEDTIEQADQPQAGETPEPLDLAGPGSSGPEPAEEQGAQGTFLPPTPPASADASDQTAADTPGGGISGRPFSGLDSPPADADQQQTEEQPKADDDDPDDWRTWSGRSVNP